MPSWSRDGRFIYCGSARGGGQLHVWKKGGGWRRAHADHANGGRGSRRIGRRTQGLLSNGLNGIWQVSPDGQGEQPVPGLENVHNSRYFAFTARGAYFLRDATPPGELVFYDFATRRFTPLVNLQDKFLRSMPSLSVTSDDGWLLYAEVDNSGSDILMLDNLR